MLAAQARPQGQLSQQSQRVANEVKQQNSVQLQCEVAVFAGRGGGQKVATSLLLI